MRRITRRIALAGAIAIIAPVIAIAGMASAATAAPTHPAAAPHAGLMSPNSARQPDGCNNNNFCSYNAGNGGDLCFQTSSNKSVWPSACLDANDGAYNRNGNSINLYRGLNYTDAYFTLYSGNYLLYMSKNDFNACPNGGTNCSGYGQDMQNKVGSSRFNS
jgi:hypothetical protein